MLFGTARLSVQRYRDGTAARCTQGYRAGTCKGAVDGGTDIAGTATPPARLKGAQRSGHYGLLGSEGFYRRVTRLMEGYYRRATGLLPRCRKGVITDGRACREGYRAKSGRSVLGRIPGCRPRLREERARGLEVDPTAKR